MKRIQSGRIALGICAAFVIAAFGMKAADGLAAPRGFAAQPAPDPSACQRLASLSRPGVRFDSVEVVAAGSFQVASDDDQQPRGAAEELGRLLRQLPAFCRVGATLSPTADSAIGLELWLPLSGWNGKFQGVGNGAFNGNIAYPALANALARGYAASSTDTGHRGNNASFAVGHPERLLDFGSRAVHVMTVESKALIAEFYRQPARWSYWNGCSAGGRQGLKEAQEFPADYDGIIAGSPGLDWSGRTAQTARLLKQTLNPDARLAAADRALLHEAALTACDAQDGLRDGLIADPRRCTVPLSALRCGGAQSRCLSDAKIATAELMYQPLVAPSDGRRAPGVAPGSELAWTERGWTASAQATALEQFRFLVYHDASWEPSRYAGDSELARVTASDAGVIDARNVNLRPFFARGGKLLQYHGWADAQISPLASTQYYESVTASLGAPVRASSYRLFMASGMGHCRGGEGPNSFDAVTAMEKWVEQGQVPDRIEASHSTNGEVDRTRPLCAYPLVASYRGSGSIDDAASFECR